MRTWEIFEHRDVIKAVSKLPPWIVKEYEKWKELIRHHGPNILHKYPGYHDESLKGERKGQRSSRLSQKYRVIYSLNQEEVLIWIFELSAHRY